MNTRNEINTNKTNYKYFFVKCKKKNLKFSLGYPNQLS